MAIHLPPQAYTRDTFIQAYEWLQSQPASVRELASSPDTLVSLYLQYRRRGAINTNPVSSQAFKQDLKNLAQGLKQFEETGQHPAVHGGSEHGAGPHPIREVTPPQQPSSGANATGGAGHASSANGTNAFQIGGANGPHAPGTNGHSGSGAGVPNVGSIGPHSVGGANAGHGHHASGNSFHAGGAGQAQSNITHYGSGANNGPSSASSYAPTLGPQPPTVAQQQPYAPSHVPQAHVPPQAPLHARGNGIWSSPQGPHAATGPDGTWGPTYDETDFVNLLDAKTIEVVRRVQMRLNLSNEKEALRLLIAMGFERIREMLPRG